MTPIENRELPTRVLLISGFLGAGKTTLLKHILSWQTDMAGTVVLVNEFGEVGIDGLLLEDSGSRVVELASGCICCTLRGDLQQTLKTILQQYHPRNLLIEASGVADPVTIVSVLTSPPFASDLRLEKMVTVLDADYWEARENFGQIFYHQLHTANLILLNKADLAGPNDISRYLHEIHAEIPNCQVVPTIRCQIDSSALWMSNQDALELDTPIADIHQSSEQSSCAPVLHANSATPPFTTFVFTTSKPVNEACFKDFIEKLPSVIFRLKGPIRFETHMTLINFVGGKAEWLPWRKTSDTRLVFIGWNYEASQDSSHISNSVLNQLNRCVLN